MRYSQPPAASPSSDVGSLVDHQSSRRAIEDPDIIAEVLTVWTEARRDVQKLDIDSPCIAGPRTLEVE